MRVDAIVNAANRTLLGGGGVDGAIHRAAGPRLKEECKTLCGCETGQAKITGGHDLPAKWVIHAVGPVWHGGDKGEDELLASCYRRCFEIAGKHGIESIAFPAISTGAYGFPLEGATRIALEESFRYLEAHELPVKVVFVCFTRGILETYRRVFDDLAGRWSHAGTSSTQVHRGG